MEQEIEQDESISKNQRRKLKNQEKRLQKEALRKKQQFKKVLSYFIIIVVVVGSVWGVVKVIQKNEASKPGQKVATQGNQHIEIGDAHVAYNTTPPTSGPHAGTARWGIHSQQIVDENQIHNLEDGGVGIQYDCDKEEASCQELVEGLKIVVQKYGNHVFMGPYSGINSRIALTAWQRIDLFDEFDEQRIVDFIDEYRGIDHHNTVGK